ncbi:hypothetical protein Rhe02_88070 [Rhizocola hellebori]|uniref:Uncharacterized protein n=1 Tax=Rhizocola hellebori TaxID=1392758 RepID=A0A8J3QH21_9ACTN|nr:hypothetical protein [Rhizocola hellebori]GIH10740.1 hypothetical protein Rhe02_88070 [Rhizocola hellebori]
MSTFNIRQGALGLVIGLAGHGIAFLFGFLAGQLVEPSQGGGFEDIAAVALIFLGVEALLGVAAVIATVMLARRGKRDLGFGVLAGWLVGVIGVLVLLRA